MSFSFPTLMAILPGMQPGPGEGTVSTLENSWSWPPWLTLLFVVFAVVFVVLLYLREGGESSVGYRLGLAALRLGLVAVVLFMLAQFVLSVERTGLPYVAVLVDDSLSMTIADHYDSASQAVLKGRAAPDGDSRYARWKLAQTLLTERDAAFLRRIEKSYKLRVYYVTGARASQAPDVGSLAEEIGKAEPVGGDTRLGTAVRSVLDDLRGSSPAAIVLLTDGINTDGPDLAEAAAYARRKEVPLYLIGLGDERPVRNLRLHDLLVDDVVFAGDVVYFEFKLTATGYAGREVRVVLHEEGKNQVLAEMRVKLGPDGHPQQVRLPYRPTQEGEFHYVVEAGPLEGELQPDDNSEKRTVRVRKEKIRVLLVQAYPSFEYRYLRQMLLRDSTIQLNTVLQEADLEHAEEAEGVLPGFPVRREELFQYDVIILGDVNPALLNPTMMQNLAEFVDQPGKGGALVCIAGPRYMPLAFRETPLARLLPVNPATVRLPDPNQGLREGFQVRPTELGLASPPMQLGDTPADTQAVWSKLPPLYWMVEATDLKPAARVLAENPTAAGRDGRRLPVIVLQFVGSGKVLFHATDETWRWRYRVGDVFFARYWVQMIRYLCRSKLSEGDRSAVLSTDRREYRRGESVPLRVRFADERLAPAEDDGVVVALERRGYQTQRIKLHRSTAGRGVFEGTLTAPPIGSYHAWVASPTFQGSAPAVDFVVAAPPGEFEHVEMEAAEMRRAAELSDGRFYTFFTADKLLAELPEGHQVPIESLPPKPLWNTTPVLLAFLVLLVAEWVLRKLGGMV